MLATTLLSLTALQAPLAARPALAPSAMRAPVLNMVADAFLPLDAIEPVC